MAICATPGCSNEIFCRTVCHHCYNLTRPRCQQPDCDNPRAVRGDCMTHYRRLRDHGTYAGRNPLTPEHRAKISAAKQGVKFSEEHRKHLSEGQVEGHARVCVMPGCRSYATRQRLCEHHFRASRDTTELCSQPDCGLPSHGRGLCVMHYQKFRRQAIREFDTSDVPYAPAPAPVKRRKPCSVEGCGRETHAKGLCRKHYVVELHRRAKPCLVRDCDRPADAAGLCLEHYRRTCEGEPMVIGVAEAVIALADALTERSDP